MAEGTIWNILGMIRITSRIQIFFPLFSGGICEIGTFQYYVAFTFIANMAWGKIANIGRCVCVVLVGGWGVAGWTVSCLAKLFHMP